MKGYALGYMFGSVLIAAAFILMFIDIRMTLVRTKDLSWVFFLMGVIVFLSGWTKHKRELKKRKG